MIKVENTVRCYELNANQCSGDSMYVHSHWNINQWVVLEVNGTRVSVNADDLRVAINNATNSGRR